MAQILCAILRRFDGEEVRIQWNDALLGLDTRYRQRSYTSSGPWLRDWAHFDKFCLDAPDYWNSPIFNDESPSGFGGRHGDPANDYQMTTGGFKDMILAYPNPHRLRRNVTLYPYTDPNAPNPFAGDPTAPPFSPDLLINTTFTKEKVDELVNSAEGDLMGFQAIIESPTVSSTLLPQAFGRPDSSV